MTFRSRFSGRLARLEKSAAEARRLAKLSEGTGFDFVLPRCEGLSRTEARRETARQLRIAASDSRASDEQRSTWTAAATDLESLANGESPVYRSVATTDTRGRPYGVSGDVIQE